MSAMQRDTVTPRFGIDVVPDRDVVRLSPFGEIDLATGAPISERAQELLAAGFRRVVLDLRAVTFLDSTALHLILQLTASARSDGWEFAVISGPPDVQRLFDVTGLRNMVPFVDATQIRQATWSRAEGDRVPRASRGRGSDRSRRRPLTTE
jgi:anti-anti-sigma factor